MQKPLFISSKMSGSIGKSHDFKIKFNPILEFFNDAYVALDSVSTEYGWYNVRGDQYENNIFYYTNDITTNPINWTPITFKDGIYTYDQLNDIIRDQIVKDSKAHSSDNPGINFKMDYSISRVYIELATNFGIDFTKNNFHKLLGFESKILKNSEYGNLVPDITNIIDDIQIRISILDKSNVNGLGSDVLYQFSTAGLRAGKHFKIEPRRLLWNKINSHKISEIRIYLTDQLERPLNLYNSTLSLNLILGFK